MATKPGFKTTEFWLSVLVMALGAFTSSGVLGEDHWAVQLVGLIIAGLGAAGYTMARAKTKFGDSLKEGAIASRDPQ